MAYSFFSTQRARVPSVWDFHMTIRLKLEKYQSSVCVAWWHAPSWPHPWLWLSQCPLALMAWLQYMRAYTVVRTPLFVYTRTERIASRPSNSEWLYAYIWSMSPPYLNKMTQNGSICTLVFDMSRCMYVAYLENNDALCTKGSLQWTDSLDKHKYTCEWDTKYCIGVRVASSATIRKSRTE